MSHVDQHQRRKWTEEERRSHKEAKAQSKASRQDKSPSLSSHSSRSDLVASHKRDPLSSSTLSLSTPLSTPLAQSSPPLRKEPSSSPSSSFSATSTAASSSAPVSANKKDREPSAAPSGTSAVAPMQFDNLKKKKKYERQGIVTRTKIVKQVPLFSHLPQYEREVSLTLKIGLCNHEIPPPVLQVGLAISHGQITGGNARCVAMLLALRKVLQVYRTPEKKALRDDLLQRIKPWVRFLSDCRPLSASMGNAIRTLKQKIASTSPLLDEDMAKEQLIESIDEFVRSRIVMADQEIAKLGSAHIGHGDVILTFASSHVVELLLKRAYDEGKRFRTIVVDARPNATSEARQLLNRLAHYGLLCTYILLPSISNVMPQVSLVFFGAHSMLSNGSCVSRCGSSIVAMMAKLYSIPVLVCCEVYKFVEKVQLDSISSNELGDPDQLIFDHNRGPKDVDLRNWREQPSLKLLDLVYDLTPAEFVTMVVTEEGNVPPSSIPVMLREYHEVHVDSDVVE